MFNLFSPGCYHEITLTTRDNLSYGKLDYILVADRASFVGRVSNWR